ncbi:hypothetical protein HCJ25_14020 [Listeria sp. FSL L7-1426]|uniref:hypothetical protein n=1 Tax=Listeria cossartiae TaxID=2838249 RepID=UPI00162A166F|nr:hypothetical protein [Listeria cossartiae]MBC1572761.1 hypothetical protein [Listeria cossartiae subsp. cossartiae]
MHKWKKWIAFICLASFIWISFSTIVQAEETIKDKPVNGDPVTIYRDYENFSFPLMTKETESKNPITKTMTNMNVGIKNITWEATEFVGSLNAKATGFLFDFDAMSPIRKPILDLTNEFASSLLGVATYLGVMAAALFMIIKFAMEQNFKQALLVFLMATLVVASIITLGNPKRSEELMKISTDVDTIVAGAFMNNNKALEDSKDNSNATPGEKVAANIFKANVFVPYLINNYGTSDLEIINKTKIEYDKKSYSRLGLLMNNGDSDEVSEDFVSDIAKIEYDNLNNKNVGWKKSIGIAMINIFFLLLNIIQFIIYFLLFLVKCMLGFLLLFMFPLSVFVLLFSMFSMRMNPFKNIAKGYLIVMLFKGAVSFLAGFYASYMIIAYRTSDAYGNVFTKIIIILLYVLIPLILIIWRTLIFSLILGMITGQGMAPHRLANQLVHPIQSSREAKVARRERASNRNNGRGRSDRGRANIADIINVPRQLVRRANKARKGLQNKRNEQKEAQQESARRVQASEARRGQKQAESRKEKDYGRLFKDVPIGEGRNGELSESQKRVQAKREQIQDKHEKLRQQKRMGENTQQHRAATASNLNRRRQNRQSNSTGRSSQDTKKTPPLKKGSVQPKQQNAASNVATKPIPKSRNPRHGSAIRNNRQANYTPRSNVANASNTPRMNTNSSRNNATRATTRNSTTVRRNESKRQPIKQNIMQRPKNGTIQRQESSRQRIRRK